jgi:hypothetical protein
LGLIENFQEITGKNLQKFVVVNFEYGPDFSGPGKVQNTFRVNFIFSKFFLFEDVFKLDRAISDIQRADESNFLHPVFYYFDGIPKLTEKKSHSDILIHAESVHHIIEDFTTFWTDIKKHRLHLRRYFESVLGTDLREFKIETCAKLFIKYGSYPISCSKLFNL